MSEMFFWLSLQTSYCNNDRLEISYGGSKDLADGERYCNDNPFVAMTKSNALVVGKCSPFAGAGEKSINRRDYAVSALKVPNNSPGGQFLCRIEARACPLPAMQPVNIQYPGVPPGSFPPPQRSYPGYQQQVPQSAVPQYPPNSYAPAYPSGGVIVQQSSGSAPAPYPPQFVQRYPEQSYPQQSPSIIVSSSMSSGSNYQNSGYQSAGYQPGYRPPYPAVVQSQPSYQPVGVQSSSVVQSQPYPAYPAAYPAQPLYQPVQSISQQAQQGQQQAQASIQYYRPYGPSAQPGFQTVYQPMSPQGQYQPQCMCGMRKQARIVGGTTTNVNEFPFFCGIIDMATKRILCGCTIIHENFVLTAAHCILNQSLPDLGCVVGGHEYSIQANSPFTSVYRFSAFIPYPNYDPVSYLNDIAIMRTYELIQFNAAVSPVCLPIR